MRFKNFHIKEIKLIPTSVFTEKPTYNSKFVNHFLAHLYFWIESEEFVKFISIIVVNLLIINRINDDTFFICVYNWSLDAIKAFNTEQNDSFSFFVSKRPAFVSYYQFR